MNMMLVVARDSEGAKIVEQQVLDIAQFQNHPTESYYEVYRILLHHNWYWKMVQESLLGVHLLPNLHT